MFKKKSNKGLISAYVVLDDVVEGMHVICNSVKGAEKYIKDIGARAFEEGITDSVFIDHELLKDLRTAFNAAPNNGLVGIRLEPGNIPPMTFVIARSA